MIECHIKEISGALDRLQEAHWHIHQMESSYHESESFRYSLNSFLRVIKEVPDILQMELQNKNGFTKWFRERKKLEFSNSLIAGLFKKRDIIVHREMLKPKSSAFLGITEGRGLKSAFSFPLNPFEDSDVLIIKYLNVFHCEDKHDLLGILIDDEDSVPCIERHWRLDPFDKEIMELVVEAWGQIGLLVDDSLKWLGGPSINHNLSCVHNSSEVSMIIYKREWLKKIEKLIDKGIPFDKQIQAIKILRLH